jgi:hypothetical protein
VLDSTVELQAAIEQIFKGQPLPDWRKGAPPPEQPGPSQMPGPRGGFKAFIEGDPASGSFSIRVAPASEASQAPPPKPPEPDQESLSLAARVFQLLSALDPDNRLRKAPPIKVFLLRFRQDLSLSQIARICDCGKSLVALRLQAIREKLPWQPKQLREMSAQVEAMQDALTDPRARSIYRKGSVYGDEDDGPESD